MTAADIMSKGLVTISPDETMKEASKVMEEKNFRHLPVSDGTRVIGIISDRDVKLAMSVVLDTELSKETHIADRKKVSQYMTSPVVRVHKNSSIKSIVREMLDRKLSCLIVEDDMKEVGIITTEDLLIYLADHLDDQVSFFTKFQKIFR
jgi:acetoin utilization protein AcuB